PPRQQRREHLAREELVLGGLKPLEQVIDAHRGILQLACPTTQLSWGFTPVVQPPGRTTDLSPPARVRAEGERQSTLRRLPLRQRVLQDLHEQLLQRGTRQQRDHVRQRVVVAAEHERRWRHAERSAVALELVARGADLDEEHVRPHPYLGGIRLVGV